MNRYSNSSYTLKKGEYFMSWGIYEIVVEGEVVGHVRRVDSRLKGRRYHVARTRRDLFEDRAQIIVPKLAQAVKDYLYLLKHGGLIEEGIEV